MKRSVKNTAIRAIRPFIRLSSKHSTYNTENTRKLNKSVRNPLAPYTILATCGRCEYELFIEELFIEPARYMGKFKAISTDDSRLRFMNARCGAPIDKMVGLDLLVQEQYGDKSVISPSVRVIERAYSPVSHAFARGSVPWDPVR